MVQKFPDGIVEVVEANVVVLEVGVLEVVVLDIAVVEVAVLEVVVLELVGAGSVVVVVVDVDPPSVLDELDDVVVDVDWAAVDDVLDVEAVLVVGAAVVEVVDVTVVSVFCANMGRLSLPISLARKRPRPKKLLPNRIIALGANRSIAAVALRPKRMSKPPTLTVTTKASLTGPNTEAFPIRRLPWTLMIAGPSTITFATCATSRLANS